MKKKLIILVFLLLIFQFVTIGCTNINDTYNPANILDDPHSNTEFISSKESKNFDYTYIVEINSNTSSEEYTSVNFIIEIKPKNKLKLDNLIATAYLDENIFKYIAIKSYNTFGINPNEPLNIDTNNNDEKGFSIARGTWIYKNTNIEEFIKEINKGINLEVKWDTGIEYVHIDSVTINK